MKKIKYIVSCFIIVLLLNACNALDLSPEDWYGSTNFWNNKAQVEGFMLGLHADLRSQYPIFQVLGEYRGGTHRTGTSSVNTSLDYSSPIKSNEFTYDKTGISNWYLLYNNIMQVNHFIQKVEEECDFLTDSERGFFLGQGYGLRALYYTMLYKTYGGVPLIETVKVLDGKVTAENLYTARSSAETILNFIKSDLEASERNFGSDLTFNATRWSKYTTLMLKADVYLWSAKVSTADHQAKPEDLNVAKAALNEVIGKFRLMNDFSEVFSVKGNDEVIFAIRFADKEATNFGYLYVYSQDVFVGQKYGRDGNLITTDTLNLKSTGLLRHEYKYGLFLTYDDDDLRRDKTFLDYTSRDSEGNITDYGLSMKKYIGSINSDNNRIYDTDIILFRYADVLLMMAEIENKLNNFAGVKTYMDQIRERAYGSNYNDTYAFTPGTFEENERAILRERDKEFVGEGKRWFDVVRMQDGNGKSLVFSVDANYKQQQSDYDQPVLSESQAYMILWPIDVNTLNNDSELVNNPGYEAPAGSGSE